MIAYHELTDKAAAQALKDGLKCTSRGDKGSDSDIIKTDALLDEWMPKALKHAGVSRDNNLYAYLCINDMIIDITDGKPMPRDKFICARSQVILELQVDAQQCYVSDLTLYDAVLKAVKNNEPKPVLRERARAYYAAIRPAADFTLAEHTRPELMITRDVPSSHLLRKN